MELTLQRIQLRRPEAFHLREPLIELGEARRIDAVDAALRVDANRDQLRLAQHSQMLRDGGRAEIEVLHNLPGGELSLRQNLHDLAASRVGKGSEGEHEAAIIAQVLK